MGILSPRHCWFGLLVMAGCATNPAGHPPTEDLAWSRKVGSPPDPDLQWELVMSQDFDGAQLPAGSLVTDGTWEVRDGRLWATAGGQQRAIMLGPALEPPVRIEFECTNRADPEQGTIGDITVHANAVPGSGAELFAQGYALTTGSYYNNCSTFYRNGRPLAKTEFSPVRDNVTHRVCVEIIGGHLRYWLDDTIVLEAWDPQPLTEWSGRSLGLRTWNTLMAVDRLRVYRGKLK